MAGKLYRVRIPPWARGHFEGKIRETRRFTDPVAAKIWVKDIESKLAQLRGGKERESVGVRPPPEKITFEAAADQWKASLRVRPRTMKSYGWTLNPVYRWLGGAPLDQLDLAAWDRYAAARRREGGSDDALLRERQVVQAIAKWAVARGFAINPQVFAIKKPKKPIPTFERRYDPEAVEKALEKLTGRDRIVALLAMEAGFRPGELRAARVEWMRWKERTIIIPHCQEFSPKGGRPRPLPMSKLLYAELRAWVGERTSGLLFPPTSHQKVGSGFAVWRIIKALRDAGAITHGLQDLRHHYASSMAAAGLGLRDVQELMGHRHSKTTDRYMHPSPTYQEAARRALDRRKVGSEVGSGKKKSGRGKKKK